MSQKLNVTCKDYLQLIKLSKGRKHSPETYARFESYQAKLLMRYLEQHQIFVKGLRILDLGCGSGGYLEELSKAGADVVGLDLPRMALRKGFIKVVGDAVYIPFASGSFDLVLCINLIEHVTDQLGLLSEMARVVKQFGWIYLGFPPFYSLNGGHSLTPYHYLGEKAAVWILNWKRRKHIPTGNWGYKTKIKVNNYQNLFGYYGLQVTTLATMDRLIEGLEFMVLDRSTKYSPINFSGIPVLREVLNWHVQYLLNVPSNEKG